MFFYLGNIMSYDFSPEDNCKILHRAKYSIPLTHDELRIRKFVGWYKQIDFNLISIGILNLSFERRLFNYRRRYITRLCIMLDSRLTNYSLRFIPIKHSVRM